MQHSVEGLTVAPVALMLGRFLSRERPKIDIPVAVGAKRRCTCSAWSQNEVHAGTK